MKNNNKNTFSDKQKESLDNSIAHLNNAKTNKKEYNALLHKAIDELNNVKNENNNRNERKRKERKNK